MGYRNSVKKAWLGLLLVLTLATTAMAGEADGRFEVASVRPSSPGRGPSMSIIPVGGRFLAEDISLRNLITLAYGVKNENLFQLPKWADSSHYTIQAKPSVDVKRGAAPFSMAQEMGMLRNLLEDRFQLRVRWESRERAGLGLILAGGKVKLHEPDKHGCAGGAAILPMKMFVTSLEREFEKPVTNLTGLNGNYCIGLRWQAVDGTPKSMGLASGKLTDEKDDNADMSLVTALREQLGLKVQPQRTAVPVLVVDSVQQPSPN